MFRELPNEKWKEVQDEEYYPRRMRVFISNYGRLKHRNVITGEEELKNLSNTHGFPSSYFTRKEKRAKTFYIHKMMGELFLEKTSDDQKFVIHLDHNLENNHVDNLKHVNRKELSEHQVKNPKWINSKRSRKGKGHKLTETQVKFIKRKIFDPNRKTRLRLIAKQFGISEMQLYRIKTGENWGHVTEY